MYCICVEQSWLRRTVQKLQPNTMPPFVFQTSTPEIIFICKHKQTQFCHCMKGNLCSKTTQWCNFFFLPSPPSNPCLCEALSLSLRLQNDGTFAWRKKKHGSLWYASPLHAFPLVLLAGPAHQGQIIVGNLAHSSFSFLCLAVMMVRLLRCNRAREPITDPEFSWLQEVKAEGPLLHFIR